MLGWKRDDFVHGIERKLDHVSITSLLAIISFGILDRVMVLETKLRFKYVLIVRMILRVEKVGWISLLGEISCEEII
jgi:hypothetical protein